MQALNQPVSWWGWHGYSQPQPLTITQIIAAGNLSPEMAALLWIGLERGASIVVASDPPSSGKTTTLSALLPFFPTEALLYFTRGLGERFEGLDGPSGRPVYLMVNEISDHLPVYSWGSHVQRIFELMDTGYALASTMHCDSVEEVVEQLVTDIGVDRSLVGNLTLVVPIAIEWQGGSVRRRVTEVAMLRKGEEGPAKTTLAAWDGPSDRFGQPEEGGLAELGQFLALDPTEVAADVESRAGLLAGLVEKRAVAAAIEEAISSYSFGQARR